MIKKSRNATDKVDETTLSRIPPELAHVEHIFSPDYQSNKVKAIMEVVDEIRETRPTEKIILFVRGPHFDSSPCAKMPMFLVPVQVYVGYNWGRVD